MSTPLIVNPFTDLFHDETEFQLVSPKPGEGLSSLHVQKADHPHLFDLLLDLSKLRLDFLDIDNDLDPEERSLLYEGGVLVEVRKSPKRPLFSCQLNDCDSTTFLTDSSSLSVNPSFRFDPVSLGSFNSYASKKNLSPYQPIAWIKTIGSEIELGYWLDEYQATVISGLEVGKPPSNNIDDELRGKLINAEVLLTSEKLSKSKTDFIGYIQKNQKNFRNDKYTTLRNLLPPAQMKAMRNYYREYIENGFMPFGDEQVKRRYYQHNEPLAMFLHGNLTNLMSLIANKPVMPSYVFAASYEDNAVLLPHTDRAQCEFSLSFQVDYLPKQKNETSPWGLFFTEPKEKTARSLEKHPAKNQSEDSNLAAYLASGDALAYKGCELTHYRYPLPKGHKSTSLFFHYVPVDFEGELN